MQYCSAALSRWMSVGHTVSTKSCADVAGVGPAAARKFWWPRLAGVSPVPVPVCVRAEMETERRSIVVAGGRL